MKTRSKEICDNRYIVYLNCTKKIRIQINLLYYTLVILQEKYTTISLTILMVIYYKKSQKLPHNDLDLMCPDEQFC